MNLCGYKIYFWSNENQEPIHIHISKGIPNGNSTKIWLTKRGGSILANNNSKIPNKDLRELQEIVENNFFFIIAKWKQHFPDEEIKFYC